MHAALARKRAVHCQPIRHKALIKRVDIKLNSYCKDNAFKIPLIKLCFGAILLWWWLYSRRNGDSDRKSCARIQEFGVFEWNVSTHTVLAMIRCATRTIRKQHAFYIYSTSFHIRLIFLRELPKTKYVKIGRPTFQRPHNISSALLHSVKRTCFRVEIRAGCNHDLQGQIISSVVSARNIKEPVAW